MTPVGWRRHIVVLTSVVLAAACAPTDSDSPDEPRSELRTPGALGGKADNGLGHRAPDWLLSSAGAGTWSASPNSDALRAWVDARVANRRHHKRIFVEVAAPYEGGATMRTLHPTWFEADMGGGDERWGTDTIEIYPTGGPGGTALAGPVVYRLRMQEDPDGDGVDQIVVTPWEVLHGDGEPAPPALDPWRPGWRSPARATGEMPGAEIYFAPFDDPGLVVVREINRVIEAQLDSPGERHTIHAAIFNINDPRIVDRLIAAHDAGVEVRLLTESTKLRPSSYWQTEDDRLLAAGVPLLGIRRRGSGAMHAKFALFDGRRIATGSFNWEPGSSADNHENLLLTDAPDLVGAYARRFETLAAQPQQSRQFAHDSNEAVSVGFAPDEAIYRTTGELIDAARHSIYVAMFTCKDVEYTEWGEQTSLFRKLGAAVQRGVEVIVITDFGIAEASEYYGRISDDDPMDEWLESLGVHVVRADNRFGPYASMHHKFAVIDGRVVVTGAFNWYYDAAYLNDEDQLVMRDPVLAADYAGEIVDLLRRYDPDSVADEWPRTSIQFEVEHRQTRPGDTAVIVGDLPELGGWDPARGQEMDPSAWPIWKTSIELPAGVRFEYKVATAHPDGTFSWQHGDNHTLRVPTDQTHVVITQSW